MGLSCRLFLLDQDNGLYRLPNTTFDQMLRDPTSHCWPDFAGTRMRMTDVVVELLDRQPIRVVWITFGVVSFDSHGYFDQGAFDRQQRARAELALAPLGTEVPRLPLSSMPSTASSLKGGVGRHREPWPFVSTKQPWAG